MKPQRRIICTHCFRMHLTELEAGSCCRHTDDVWLCGKCETIHGDEKTAGKCCKREKK